jgi:hypothetical protein
LILEGEVRKATRWRVNMDMHVERSLVGDPGDLPVLARATALLTLLLLAASSEMAVFEARNGSIS